MCGINKFKALVINFILMSYSIFGKTFAHVEELDRFKI